MRQLTITPILLLLALQMLAFSAAAQPKPEYDMGRMQLVLLHQTANEPSPAEVAAQSQALKTLIETGKVAMAGPVTEGGTLREIVVFKSDSADDAATIAAGLPLVRAGQQRAEHLTWYAARNLVKPVAKVEKLQRYVFGLLVAGPNSPKDPPKEPTEESKQLQAGHMAHIQRMADAGVLVLAGPFVKGGTRRGVFLFKLDDLAAAKAWCDQDPAVKAGRLAVEFYFWSVPVGVVS